MELRVTVRKRDEPGPEIAIVSGDGFARAVVWPGMGAQKRSLLLVSLELRDTTRVLEHSGEAVYYVPRGGGSVHGAGAEHPLDEGTFVHTQPGTPYWFSAPEGMVLVGGPCPPDPALFSGEPAIGGDPAAVAAAGDDGGIRIFHRDRPSRMLPLISSDARLVVWPGVGAHDAPMNYVRLQPGEANEPHAHASSEDTIYILDGRGSIADLSNDVVLEFEAGDALHIPPGVQHAVRADRGSDIESVGGPAPADPVLAGTAAEAGPA